MKILVVDDDDILREELTEWLSSEGHEAESADRGGSAVEKVKSSHFDLVLTDLKMPGMNGMDVLRAVKEIRPDIHIVMITAFGTIDTAINAMKEGADDYICKPFEMDNIREAIKDIAKTMDIQNDIKGVEISIKSDYQDPFEFFKSMAQESSGLWVTQKSPEEAHTDEEKISMLWVRADDCPGQTILPRDISKIRDHVESFFRREPEGVVLFDCVESLIEEHSWDVVKKTLSDILTNHIDDSARFIISTVPDKIETDILQDLKEMISKPRIQLVSESLSNPIRRNIVRYLSDNDSARFRDILKELGLNDPPKLSFHLKKLVTDGILEKDEDKGYALTSRGKSTSMYLHMLEEQVIHEVQDKVSLILNSK